MDKHSDFIRNFGFKEFSDDFIPTLKKSKIIYHENKWYYWDGIQISIIYTTWLHMNKKKVCDNFKVFFVDVENNGDANEDNGEML